MKKYLSVLLVVVLTLGLIPGFAVGDAAVYHQAPMLDALVADGTLPPVEERLPDHPKLAEDVSAPYLENGVFEIGAYGGTLRSVGAVVNYNADIFIMMTENLFTMVDTYSGIVTPNLLESYEVNEEMTEYTFHIRKGLKWSDGAPVTMEDYRFGIEDYLFNSELTQVIPGYMRDGGTMAGDPLQYEFVDDETFKITFKQTFGGFLVHLSVAGWKDYSELLKPAHYMKRFHKDYAEECHGSLDAYYEFIKPYAQIMGYEDEKADGVWVLVMEQINVKGSEMTNANASLTSVMFADAGEKANFPVLYPWMMESSKNGLTTWVRNPYYHKVDAAGNQLPYIDYLTNQLVEDMEMVQMKIISGEVDYMRESATINNIKIYTENAERANINVLLRTLNNTPTDVTINMNYTDPAWQQCATDIRFRTALMLAVDAEEIIDTVYNGFAEINQYQDLPYDPDAANALLDEMGMSIGDDGYRTAPDGTPLSWFIYNAQDTSDVVPVCELLVEFWNTELKLNVHAKSIESSLLGTMQQANELPMRVSAAPVNVTWFNSLSDFGWMQAGWGPLWYFWWKNGGETAEDASSVGGLEPPEEVRNFYRGVESIMTADPATAVAERVPAVSELMAEQLWLLIPIQNVQQAIVANKNLKNIPVKGISIAGNFVGELFYYDAEAAQ